MYAPINIKKNIAQSYRNAPPIINTVLSKELRPLIINNTKVFVLMLELFTSRIKLLKIVLVAQVITVYVASSCIIHAQFTGIVTANSWDRRSHPGDLLILGSIELRFLRAGGSHA